MSYLSVTKFGDYQHYKNRKPRWVKLYVDLLDPHNKLNYLPVEARFLFDRLLLLAAEWDNAIPNDSELIARLVVMQPRECRECLEMLLKGRWIIERKTKRRASKPASNPASRNAPPETEAEAEREKEKAVAATINNALNRRLPISLEKQIELGKMLPYLHDRDDGSLTILETAAKKVPLAAVCRIRESVQHANKRVGVGYAVNALKSEAEEAA